MMNNFFRSLVFLLIAFQAQASSFTKVDMDDLATKSELIFEGEVLSKAVRPSPYSGQPCTYFLFRIIDVIKGDYPDPTIRLCFAGGTLNGITLQVSDMTMPTVGETGIYFVATLKGEPTHPLFGWHQGHYLVRQDGSKTKKVVPAFPESGAAGGTLKKKSGGLENAPSVDAFKQMIRDRL